MKPEFKKVCGFDVPIDDVECCEVVFTRVTDLNEAYGFCRKFDIAVQAGGNFGYWPMKLAEKFQTVYTFEPDPVNFSCMCRNIGDIQNIIKIQAGLGHMSDCVELKRERKNAGAHYVRGKGMLPIIRIDDLALRGCDLIVLDIEGMELNALLGAMATIDAYRPVIHVEDKGLSERYGTEQGKIEEWLSDFGYQVRARPHRDVILSC